MANSSDIGSDVEVTDKDVLDLKSEAEAVVFGGSWFSVVRPDTFQLPSPIFFRENAGPDNTDRDMSIMLSLMKLLHPDDGNDEIDILV